MTPPRTENFVPLTTAPDTGRHTEFRAKVIPQATVPQPFQSLEACPPPAGTGLARAGKICEPRVTLHRDGDRVTAVRVQCTCGQVIDLVLVYDPPPEALKGKA